MKILLVEDNPLDRQFVEQSLRTAQGESLDLIQCGSLGDAITRSREITSPIDVVLLDLWLPDSEGLETCTRAIAALPDIPIVVMTATDDHELAAEVLRRGAQDYLVKGMFPGVAMARVLQYAIDRHRFRTELSQYAEQYRQVISHLPAIVWTTNRELRITSSAGAALDDIHADPRDMIGLTLAEYLAGDEALEMALQGHLRAVAGQSVTYETTFRDHIFEVKVNPLRRNRDGIIGTIGVALDVTAEHHLDREVHFAKTVQQSLMPTESPQIAGFDVYGAAYPARLTSGDWFDFLSLSDGSVGLVVGDVSGKGYGPAILSASVASYLEALAETQPDLHQIVTVCNRLCCKHNDLGRFAVLSLGRLRASERTWTYAGAGEGMLIVGRDGRLKHTIAACGLPLGLIEHEQYDVPTQVPLEPGDILVMLTDGFRESANSDNNCFGQAGVQECVAQHVDRSAREILEALRREAEAFFDQPTQCDDMTGIVVKVLP